MSEYKNGLNSMGSMSVGKDDISHDPVTGRAVFIDDARYDADSAYKAKVDDLIKQGFHKVSEGSGGSEGIKNKTLTMTVVNDLDATPEVGVMPFIIEDGIVKSVEEPFPQPNTSKVITSLIVPYEAVALAGITSVAFPPLPAIAHGTYSYVPSNEVNCEFVNRTLGGLVGITDVNSDASITVTLILSDSGDSGDNGGR